MSIKVVKTPTLRSCSWPRVSGVPWCVLEVLREVVTPVKVDCLEACLAGHPDKEFAHFLCEGTAELALITPST